MKWTFTYFRYLQCVIKKNQIWKITRAKQAKSAKNDLNHGHQAATLTPSGSGHTTTQSTSAVAASWMPSSTISANSRGCNTAVCRTHTIASNECADFKA
jgi:hypothetical protein